jgi:uncharacterized membrane protein YedE/YeeE
MANEKEVYKWKPYAIISLAAIIAITAFSAYQRLWVLTAIPIGFLLGFFLKKGELCGSSAMSEVILMKDKKKLFGFWLAIVTSMLGFAILDLFGLVTLAPKPMVWLSAIIGGAIFGVGIVLGGGCVSGCLYKAATGNINSMASVLTIPLGVSLVWYGPLKQFSDYLLTFVIKSNEGKAVSLYSITGLPFGTLALIFAIPTLLYSIVYLKKSKRNPLVADRRSFSNLFTKSWKPWQAGVAIGILAAFGYLSSASTGRNYPIGITHGVVHTYLLISDLNVEHNFGIAKRIQPERKISEPLNSSVRNTNSSAVQPTIPSKPAEPQKKVIVWWAILIDFGLVIGAFVSGKMSGEAKLLQKPPQQTVVAMVGGLLIGIGAAIATGCVIGNILSGWALMSVGMFIFGITVLIFNWITTYFYLMGGTVFRK